MTSKNVDPCVVPGNFLEMEIYYLFALQVRLNPTKWARQFLNYLGVGIVIPSHSLLLGTCVSQMRMPGFESQLHFQFQLPASASPRREQNMAQALGTLPPTSEMA